MLRPLLDRLYVEFNHPDSVVDPVHAARRYSDPADREVAAFCAAGLAFGRVGGIMASIDALLGAMGPAPAAFVRAFDPARDRGSIRRLVHRWIRGADLVALLLILQRMIGESGSIERFFLQGDDPSCADVGPGLEAFARRALETDLRPAYGRRPRAPGAAFFFPRPSSGSGCKRLNLFLRWMVRNDRIDPGGWRGVSPARLVVPLDTHVVRVGRCLGLTRYVTPGWPMAAEITAALRTLDSADPVRYDFSLCHLGMMGACGFGQPRGDAQCPLRGCCRPGGRPGADGGGGVAPAAGLR